MILSFSVAALFWWLHNEVLEKLEPWMRRPPLPSKTFLMILFGVFSTMGIMTFGVWLWAFTFQFLSVFTTLEEAVYFSLVAYTTLGLGDITIPQDHRLLGGMAGANGFLMFGLMTAMLTDTLRHIRKVQKGIPD